MVTKEQIKTFLKENCEDFAKSSNGGYISYRIDTRDDRYINLYDEVPDMKIVVAWSGGFDAEYNKDNPFVDEQGYGLCVTLRVNDNQTFGDDSYFVDEDYSLAQCDIDDGFEFAAAYMLKQITMYVDSWYDKSKNYYCPIHDCHLYPAYWSDDESGYMYCPICCKLIKIESAIYKNDDDDDEEDE